LGGSCPSQQLHCLIELITNHINISLFGAYTKAIVSLLHEKFLFHFHWKQTSFFAGFE
jgi:hypothetical protein